MVSFLWYTISGWNDRWMMHESRCALKAIFLFLHNIDRHCAVQYNDNGCFTYWHSFLEMTRRRRHPDILQSLKLSRWSRSQGNTRLLLCSQPVYYSADTSHCRYFPQCEHNWRDLEYNICMFTCYWHLCDITIRKTLLLQKIYTLKA